MIYKGILKEGGYFHIKIFPLLYERCFKTYGEVDQVYKEGFYRFGQPTDKVVMIYCSKSLGKYFLATNTRFLSNTEIDKNTGIHIKCCGTPVIYRETHPLEFLFMW